MESASRRRKGPESEETRYRRDLGPPAGTNATVAADRGLEALRRVSQRLAVTDARAGKMVGRILTDLKGAAFESLAANERLARELNSLLDRLGLRAKCPKCGEPARFVCSASSRMKNGAFFFYHTSTTHGGTGTVPALKLVSKGPDKRRKPERPKKS